MSDAGLRIGGLTRLSTCDWPGELVATIFTQGCPWRCSYCHNPSLIPAGTAGSVTWSEILAFLERRRGLLDGVVFSGGEPTLQAGLPAAMKDVRALGFGVGLHTGGAYPERLAELLPLVDWVGFDVKADFAGYEVVTGVARSGAKAAESLRRLLASGVAYEVRTTVHPRLMDSHALDHLAAQLQRLGVSTYVVQGFRTTGCEDEALIMSAAPPPQLSPERAQAFASYSFRDG